MSEDENHLRKSASFNDYNSFDMTKVKNKLLELDDKHLHAASECNKTARNKLILASVICLIFMIGEIVGGALSGSLAIMTDAAHLFTDLLSFSISLIAMLLSAKPISETFSFGWARAEVIGSFFSVQLTWTVTGVLVYLGIKRICDGAYEIQSIPMLITSAIALLVNVILVCLLHDYGGDGKHGHSHALGHSHGGNMNLRAAFIHAVGDFLQSFSVFLAAIVLYFKPSWKLIDPICTFIFSILIIFSTAIITKDIFMIFMQAAPKELPLDGIKALLNEINGVAQIGAIRVWNLTAAKSVLTVHIKIQQNADFDSVLLEATATLRAKFNFQDITIQLQKCESIEFQ